MRAGRAASVVWVIALLVAGAPRAALPGRQAAGPYVAVWYRGSPPGVPSQDELARLRAFGFHAVMWPGGRGDRAPLVERLAAVVGLAVVTPDAAGREGDGWLNLDLRREPVALVPARAWLAIAGGARLISIDAGAESGAGVDAGDGALAAWVRPALALSRQIEANRYLFASLRDRAPEPVDSSPESPVQVVLKDAGRAWVLVAANPSSQPAAVVARFPRTAPYGPWVSLQDGLDMSMAVLRTHHEYRANLAAGEARVYVIDKAGSG